MHGPPGDGCGGPEGYTVTRYSQLYIDRAKPTSDSMRLRSRLGAFVTRLINESGDVLGRAIANSIHEDLGKKVRYTSPRTHDLQKFFETAELRDVLDAISLVLHACRARAQAAAWQSHVKRAFAEENVAYRLGDDGIVHPFVDVEFDFNRTAALGALADPRFGDARNDYEAAFRHLRNGEGKQAIRMMFPAVETAAKVLCPRCI